MLKCFIWNITKTKIKTLCIKPDSNFVKTHTHSQRPGGYTLTRSGSSHQLGELKVAFIFTIPSWGFFLSFFLKCSQRLILFERSLLEKGRKTSMLISLAPHSSWISSVCGRTGSSPHWRTIACMSQGLPSGKSGPRSRPRPLHYWKGVAGRNTLQATI